MTTFWWRDDDAMRNTRQLRRLLALSEKHEAPLTLAVIGMRFDDSLVRLVERQQERVTVCLHGADHRDRSLPDEPASEFPESRDTDAALLAIRAAWYRLRDAFGTRALPLLAPPWNRISDAVRDRLHETGITGCSTETHVDPVDWHRPRTLPNRIRHRLPGEPGPRRFVGDSEIRRQLADLPDHAVLMTHHRVHDHRTWRWLDGFLADHEVTEALR